MAIVTAIRRMTISGAIALICFCVNAVAFDSPLAQVTAQIKQNLRYPPKALELHQAGTAVIKFQIDRTGRILSLGMVSKTGIPALDAEAVNVLNRIVKFDLTIGDDFQPESKSFEITMPITFDLPSQAALPTPPNDGPLAR